MMLFPREYGFSVVYKGGGLLGVGRVSCEVGCAVVGGVRSYAKAVSKAVTALLLVLTVVVVAAFVGGGVCWVGVGCWGVGRRGPFVSRCGVWAVAGRRDNAVTKSIGGAFVAAGSATVSADGLGVLLVA